MIAKISRGGGFRGSLDYILRPEAEPEIIGGNLAGETAREMSQEFSQSRRLREDIKKPVYHVSLTLPAEERLTDEEWNKLTIKYLSRMGLSPEEHQYTLVRHKDTELDHVHIVASRISLEGQLWNPDFDLKKSRNICRELEREHGLTQVSNDKKQYRAKTTQAERQMMRRTGRPTEKVIVQEALNKLLSGEEKLTHRELISALEADGIIAIPNIASTGKISGYAFQLSGRNYTGAQVGYSWKHLQKLLQEPDAEEVAYLQHRKEILQQGTPADAVRSIRNSVWEMGVRRTSFGEALEKQGWTLQGKNITKGEATYKLADLVDTEKLSSSIWQLQQISTEAREQARAKASRLSKGFYRPRRSFLAEMRPEDILVGMIMAPQAVLFLLALSVVTEAVRAMGTPGTEAELKAQLQEIWANSNDQVNLAVAEVRKGVEHRGGARTTGSNQADSNRFEGNGGKSGAENSGRGPNNAEVGSTPDPTASGTSGDDGDDGRDGEGLPLAAVDPDMDRPRGDVSRDGPATPESQPAGSQQGNDEATPALGAVAVQEWAALAQDIAILGGDDVAKTAAVQAKERAWERQAEVLTAEGGHVRYRVTCIPRGPDRDGKERFPWIPGKRGETEIFYSSDEVREMIPMLSRKNLENHDIYVTPVTEKYVYVMVDDLSEEAVKKMKADGLSPTAVWETSKGNHQAVFRLERTTPEHYRDPIKGAETRAGEELVRRLTQEYGGDVKSQGVKKAFRLAGFSNKKPERNNEFVRVLETQKDECPRVRRLFTELTEKKLPEVVEEQKTERRAIIRGERGWTVPVGATASQDCLDAYIRETRRVEGLLRARGWTEDRSVVDYRVCEAMIRQGWARESVAYCLENLSERLAERHPDTGDYVQRTIRAAVRGASREVSAPKVRRSRGWEPSL